MPLIDTRGGTQKHTKFETKVLRHFYWMVLCVCVCIWATNQHNNQTNNCILIVDIDSIIRTERRFNVQYRRVKEKKKRPAETTWTIWMGPLVSSYFEKSSRHTIERRKSNINWLWHLTSKLFENENWLRQYRQKKKKKKKL